MPAGMGGVFAFGGEKLKKWRLPLLLGLALFLSIGGLSLLFRVQGALRETAHGWEGEQIPRGDYILETFRQDEGETAMASFRVLSADRTEIYACPEAWRTMDLKGIGWTGEGYDVQIISGDTGTVTYFHSGDGWGMEREKEPEKTPAPSEPPPPPEEGLPFASPALAQQLRSKLGVEVLTEEALPRLEELESLRLESSHLDGEISVLEDLPRYCPNLRELKLSLYNRALTEADLDTVKKLPLEGLSLYMGEGYESLEIPEGLRSLALSVDPDNGEPLPLVSLLLAPVDNPEGLLEGNLEQYVHLETEGWVFELLATDVWQEETEENFWGGQECKVLVSRETDRGLEHTQTLEVQGRTNANADRSLVFADVDFDDRPDLLVCLGHFGNQGLVRYDCWLQREDGFEHCGSFSDIANPSIDREDRLILSQWRNMAVSHSWGKYEYRNGRFEESSVLTEEPAPDWQPAKVNDENVIWQWSVDGQVIGRSDQLSREEIDDLIYNENSDWGLLTGRWRTIYNGGLMADFSIYGE